MENDEYLGLGIIIIIVVGLHYFFSSIKNSEIILKLNKIVMTTEEAVNKVNFLIVKQEKIGAEVAKVVEVLANSKNVDPLLAAAIGSLEIVTNATDALIEDEPETPVDPEVEA